MIKAKIFENKESRISVRVDLKRKAVIARAARIRHTTISDFILDNAYSRAREIIADETQISMTQEQFDYLCSILDNPPRANLKKMHDLLNSKTILDE